MILENFYTVRETWYGIQLRILRLETIKWVFGNSRIISTLLALSLAPHILTACNSIYLYIWSFQGVRDVDTLLHTRRRKLLLTAENA